MTGAQKHKRIFFDLNHPADFHFYKHLMIRLEEEGFELGISARDKDCLLPLLEEAGRSFHCRGKGSTSFVGKYAQGLYLVAYLIWRLLRFRPCCTLSLSSPYLIVASRILKIPTLCYDDTDINPRLHPLIRMAHVVISPASYPILFHQHHYRIPAFKELSYLKPGQYPVPAQREGIFIRLTKTDSVHHSSGDQLDKKEIQSFVEQVVPAHRVVLSSEKEILDKVLVEDANVLHVHTDLNSCSVFWGNSATMAAEAALLGIPSVFVGAEVFSYLRDLEKAGLVHCFAPADLTPSLEKARELLSDSGTYERYVSRKNELLKGHEDALEFIHQQIHKRC